MDRINSWILSSINMPNWIYKILVFKTRLEANVTLNLKSLNSWTLHILESIDLLVVEAYVISEYLAVMVIPMDSAFMHIWPIDNNNNNFI